MAELFRVRIERVLLKDAKKVAREIGTSPQELVRLLFAQLVKVRRVPFPLSADAPADELLDVKRRNQVLGELDDTKVW